MCWNWHWNGVKGGKHDRRHRYACKYSLLQIWKWSIVTIMNVIDGMIIIAGVFLFGIKVTIWAVFAVIITTFAARFIIKRS